MASLVLSECAFSAAGITVFKHCNHLKGDIVKSLQVLKCAIQTELLIRPPMPSSLWEEKLQEQEEGEIAMSKEVDGELATGNDENENTLFEFISDDEDYEDS